MKTSTYTLIFLIFLIFLSCKKEFHSYSKFSKQFNLISNNRSEDAIFRTGVVEVMDTIVFLLNTPAAKKVIHAYSINTLEHLYSSGNRGNGPGEINNPGFAVFDKKNKVMWFRDLARMSLFKYEINKLSDSTYKPSQKISIPDRMFYIHSCYSDGKIFYNDWKQKYFIGAFDTLGNSLPDSYVIDQPGHQTLINKGPNPSYVSEYSFAKHPNIDLFAICYNYDDLILVVDRKGNVKFSANGPDKFDLFDYEEGFESKRAYVSVECTEEYIFCSYRGESAYDKKDNDYILKSPYKIHVFDWQLTPVAELLLDHEISDFAVDSIGKSIFGFSTDLGEIVEYQIPQLKTLKSSS